MSEASSSEVAAGPCVEEEREEKGGRKAGGGGLSQSFSVETLLAPCNARPSAGMERAPVTRLLAPGGGVARPREGQLPADALASGECHVTTMGILV